MSNDLIINDSVVVGLQGVAVFSEVPTDGYVLTYDNSGDGYWGPKPIPTSGGLRKEYFTSNGTWVCPEGVTNILVIAAGGGGGGAGAGYNNADTNSGIAGGGGGASLQQICNMEVIPGLTYDIVIGLGGDGGIGGTSSTIWGNNGTNGLSTTISQNSIIYFSALGGGRGGSGPTTLGQGVWCGGSSFAGTQINSGYLTAGSGGNAKIGDNINIQVGMPNYIGNYSGGAAGNDSPIHSAGGGGGGGAGPQGNGGDGGNGSIGGNGSNGSDASNNSGAGGGGGGSGNANGNGGDGGNGGSGYMYIIY